MNQERSKRSQENQGEPKKGNLYLLTGLIIGLLLGLVISWVIAPVKFSDTSPSSLRADFKNEFRSQIASAYHATNNLARAKARLSLLGDPDPIEALTIQAQQLLSSGDPTGAAYLLAYFADALKKNTISTSETNALTEIPTNTLTKEVFLLTPTLSSTQPVVSLFTPTLRPTSSPTPTQAATYILKSNQIICNSASESQLLMVEVYNSRGQPISGAEIIISWSNGEEHFFTGLQPEIGIGYADYLMTPDIVYSVRLTSGGVLVSNLSSPQCSIDSGKINWGGIKLNFQQP